MRVTPYCDLLRRASAYDGKRVRTRALWIPLFHRGSLYDDRCARVNERSGLTVPDDPPDGPERRDLYALLTSGFRAEVDLVGVFYVGKTGDVGPEGQPYGFKIECLLSVRKASSLDVSAGERLDDLSNQAIVGGCASYLLHSPDNPVDRGQMAALMVNTFFGL